MREKPPTTKEILAFVRGQELHILKHPERFTAAQVEAADALARGDWPEVAHIRNGLIGIKRKKAVPANERI